MNNNEKSLTELNAELKYLTPENVQFDLTQGGFVVAKLQGEDSFKRVHLNRIFPHDLEEEFISVTDADSNEYGIIRSLDLFDERTAGVIRHELERKYFSAKITKIVSLEERFGNSVWVVETPQGTRMMTLKDTFKSIIRIGDDRAIVIDEDANRYEIESLSALDRHSFRRIELYL